jgi:putative zinc ribbon protein
MARQCQSCGMPLKKDSDKGTEQDGTLSEKYCALCYKDGKFVDPDTTPEKIQQIADQALRKKHWPGFLRKLAIKQIPKLERWRD